MFSCLIEGQTCSRRHLRKNENVENIYTFTICATLSRPWSRHFLSSFALCNIVNNHHCNQIGTSLHTINFKYTESAIAYPKLLFPVISSPSSQKSMLRSSKSLFLSICAELPWRYGTHFSPFDLFSSNLPFNFFHLDPL